jgi:hypothetical protein
MHINNVSFIFIDSEKYISMTLFSGQPALSYDGTMHYSYDYAQQIHYPHYSQQVGPLFFKIYESVSVLVSVLKVLVCTYICIQYKAVHIIHHVLLIIFEIFQTAHTMYVASKLVHVCTFLYILLIIT